MQTQSEIVSTGLAPFRKRATWLEAIRTVLLGALVMLASVLAAMWLDLMLPISMQGRWYFTRIGFLAGIIAIAAVCALRIRRLSLARLACLVDDRASTGGEMLAGWQLERRAPPKSSALSQGFAQMASARAGERLARIAPESVLPTDRVRKVAWMLCGSIFITAALAMIMPGVAWNQYQRFLFPSRDVPPYTGVAIEMDPPQATVLYGADQTIRAKVIAGRTDFMELVTVTPDGKEHLLPMLQQRPTEWQAVLMRLTEPMDFYARSGRSRSRVGRIDVQMTPQIVSTKVRITPPAYTKRPAYEGAIPKDGIVGLAGTSVEFTVASNRPLREGRLILANRDQTNEQISLTPAASPAEADNSGGVVRGSFTLAKPGRFDISVFDVDGIESLDRASGAIMITVDQRPVVRIIEPKPLSIATPDITLPVVVAAEDDFGLTNLQLYRSLNGSPATAMGCKVDGGPRQSAEVGLPLFKYGLTPGDEIRLFARAEDNDPAGAKGAESPVTIVRIISVEQFQEMMLREKGAESIAAKYQEAERYLEKLEQALDDLQKAADAAAAKPDSKEAAAELQKKLDAAQKSAAEAASNMEKLSQQPMPIDVDRELAKRLAKMAQDAAKTAQQLGDMKKSQAGKPGGLSKEQMEQLKKMAEQHSGQRKQLDEQAIKPLERLQQAMPLIMDEQRFVELTQQQRDLAQRLESLKASGDSSDPKLERRVAELEAEQQQLRESLDSLLDDIEAQADALPDVEELQKLKATAKEFSEAVRKSDASPKMAGAQQNLLGSNFPGAIDDARKAAEILEGFLSKCKGMGGSACKSCQMAFNPSAGCPNLGNSLEQMMAMLGMKGNKSGGSPGTGFGFGAGGGYSVRSPGPRNVGMYGSMPMTPTRSSQGRGDRKSQGVATNSAQTPQNSGEGDGAADAQGNAAGQADSSVPAQYRSQVAKYFQQLNEQLGDQK
jgi:hypothetical protein